MLQRIRERAKQLQAMVVLPESSDERVLRAAKIITEQQLAQLILLTDNRQLLEEQAAGIGLDVHKTRVIGVPESPELSPYAQAFFELRKHKGITPEEARRQMENLVFFGAMMVSRGAADGFVAGARTTTADVAKAAIFCIGFGEKVKTISSAFLVNVPDCRYGKEGVFVFADCGVIPDPSPVQLANIAQSAAELFQFLVEDTPRVALLSFSTKGSAQHEMIDKVVRAREIIAEKYPGLVADGELQFDAAIVPEVAKIKCPDSPVGGRANVLVFPELNAGNIGYKMAQRLAKAGVVGPMMMGVKKPCSDLSRGCTVDEVVDAVCTTAVRAKAAVNA
ncbi:MAG: phosphate acetyltransferase [Candidatus Omnitrophica bacterium]|nr:phosphate acetyltransferase [Candidatus Omnitrophota bacterium]